jgi:hypothetical protein
MEPLMEFKVTVPDDLAWGIGAARSAHNASQLGNSTPMAIGNDEQFLDFHINEQLKLWCKKAMPAVIVNGVPQTVSRRQGRAALRKTGKFATIEAFIAAMPPSDTKVIVQGEWEDSAEFERQRPLLNQIWTAMGFTQDELDDVFKLAITL